MHYYKHHIGDFIKHTSSLNNSQSMAYLKLIWMYYEQESPLKNEPQKLAFLVGSDQQTVELILEVYFDKDGDFWRNSRCDKEIEEYRSKSAKATKSAEARWRKNAKASNSNADFMRTHSERNANELKNDANHKPVTNNHKPNNKNTGDNSPVDFSQFGFSESQFSEIQRIRTKNAKNKKQAELTDRILKALAKEFNSAKPLGYSFEDCLTTWEARGWLSFEASWLTPKEQKAPVTPLRKEFVPGGQR